MSTRSANRAGARSSKKRPDRPPGRLASGALRGPACFLHEESSITCPPGWRRSSWNRRENIRSGRLVSNPDLLVLSPTQLHPGGVDVHAARPRGARVGGRDGFDKLYLALLLPDHRSLRHAHCGFDAQSNGAGGALAVRGRMAVLAARGLLYLFLLLGAVPSTS